MDYTDLSREFLKIIFRFYRVKQQKLLNSAMQGEAFALLYIAQHDDEVVPSDVENEMCISSARTAAVLNGLENKKLITRRIDSNDRRRTILKLTPEGEEQAAKSTDQLLDLGNKMLEFLGENDAGEYVRIMGRLAGWCGDENE